MSSPLELSYGPPDAFDRATTNDSVGPYTSHNSLRGNWPLLTDQDIVDIFAQYPAEDFASEEHRIRRVVGDSQFKCSVSSLGST